MEPDLAGLKIDRPPFRPRRSAGPWVLLGVGIAAVGGLAWFWIGRARPVDVEPYTVTRSASARGTAALEASGYLEAQRKTDVSARLMGRVTWVGVEEGDRVETGQVLLRLDDRAARADTDAAEADVRMAEAELRRLQGLSPEQGVSANQLDQAVSRRDAAAARLERARADLAEMELRAPFAGIVTRRDVEVGRMAGPIASAGVGVSALLTIVDPASIEAEVEVDEARVGAARVGQPADLRVDAVPDHVYRGTVRLLVPSADRAKGVVIVRLTIDDPDDALLDGMRVRAVFLEGAVEEASTPELWIPERAVVDAEGAAAVFLVRDSRAVLHPIDAGRREGGRVEVRGGLSGGETIVRDPAPSLRDGAPVRLRGGS